MTSTLCRWRGTSVWTIAAIVLIYTSQVVAQAQPPQSAPGTSPPGDANQAVPEDNSQPISPLPDRSSGDSNMFVFKKEVEEVVLHATVVDEDRHLVSNLDQTKFSIFESGVPQTITSFRREDVPVALGIVVDNSGSMRDKRDKVNQAVLNLIRASNPKDEVFVVNFGQDYYLDQDFTSDIHLLQKALQQTAFRGTTALYDAIVASAVHLSNNTRLEKKALLVITDGQDNMSQETLEEAARRLQQKNGPVLYAIGLFGANPPATDRAALQTLAADTGGVAFFPQSLNEVDEVTRELARDIRNQYTIAYKPSEQKPKGGFQTIRVEAREAGHQLTVRTRSGYYAGETVQ